VLRAVNSPAFCRSITLRAIMPAVPEAGFQRGEGLAAGCPWPRKASPVLGWYFVWAGAFFFCIIELATEPPPLRLAASVCGVGRAER